MKIPTSRYLPINSLKNMSVFGDDFLIEISTPLTLNPDTVMRAAIGKSFRTFLDEEKKLLPFRQMSYAIQGLHKPTETTKLVIKEAMGIFGDDILSIINGEKDCDNFFYESNDWDLVALSWQDFGDKNAIYEMARLFKKIDFLYRVIYKKLELENKDVVNKLIQRRFANFFNFWNTFIVNENLKNIILIESSLYVLARLENYLSESGDDKSIVRNYLRKGRKPIGWWLMDIGDKVGCKNNKELSDLLFKKKINHNGKIISHDTLKGWSSMKKGMLMSLKGAKNIISLIDGKGLEDMMISRFALARYLSFICDFLNSNLITDDISWNDSQNIIYKRYCQIDFLGSLRK